MYKTLAKSKSSAHELAKSSATVPTQNQRKSDGVSDYSQNYATDNFASALTNT